jgi:CheY-like chemotaxis protein
VVLIVDDHPDTAAMLARLLQMHGHKAVAVNSAKDALALLQQVKPDVIVLDVTMPEMDGPTLLKLLRSSMAFSQTPVVMYSADFSQERYQETQRLGAQDYIVKGTVDIDDLCNRIGQYDQPETAQPH